MDRREFIKWSSFLTVSVAMTGTLAACGSDDGNDDSGTASPPATGANPSPTPTSFAQGVASGDPKPDSIILWTRVDGANGTDPVKVTVQVATDDAFSKLVVNDTIQADPSWDYTVRHKVVGLDAATSYYYRFVAGTITSTVGRTKTAPAAGAGIAQLKFAFISCQDWNANHWSAFSEMLNEDLDFVVHLGDYIYESLPAHVLIGQTEKNHAALTLPNGTKMADGSVYATTVADYRTLYKSYRSDPRLQALHARFPMIAIWDDHEFSDDAWQDHQTYTATDDQTEQLARRRSASQAWFEFMPADVTLDLNNPSFENIQIYRSFTFGSLATLVMTDERLYRDDHVIPESATGGFLGSRYLVGRDTLAAAEQAKIGAGGTQSMLGATQLAWWKDQMLASKANTAWRLWGNEVSLLRMQVDGQEAVVQLVTDAIVATDPGDLVPLRNTAILPAVRRDIQAIKASGTLPGTFANIHALFDSSFGVDAVNASMAAINAMLPPVSFLNVILFDADQWDGYNTERKNMMSFLKDNSIPNVVALTGDIHAFFAGPVMDDYDATTPVPVMVDLVTAGVSSTSLFRFYVDEIHTVTELAGLQPLVYQNVTNKLNGTMSAYNTWLKYIDTDAQGYAVVTLTADKLTCDFRKVKPLVNGELPAAPTVSGTTTVTVNAGVPAVVLPA
ncbi:metallophosphatase [Bordetella sp. H567]|uniref:alkaline phosphatase D family protein n=1 Tax=Bordetella sp. H567 TaxID=1697043 RepID=UPI00081C39E5|nr:alkaline phosphatase D family protein [Bordetella sp. H567]AOB30191.1 metallophosphatase [Bordetella sp. H567]